MVDVDADVVDIAADVAVAPVVHEEDRGEKLIQSQ